jgi:transcriptional regulator with XRE-family HTH domain
MIGERIAKWRRTAGLTQAEAAGLLGVSPNTWARWERGERRPDVDRLEEIARVLGVSFSKFLS